MYGLYSKKLLTVLTKEGVGQKISPTLCLSALSALPQGREHIIFVKMLFELHLPTRLADTRALSNELSLADLKAERDRLATRLLKGCDFLDRLAEQVGQDSPEFERYFREWEKVNDAYMRAEDQLTAAEARLELAAWLQKQSPPKSRRPADAFTTREA